MTDHDSTRRLLLGAGALAAGALALGDSAEAAAAGKGPARTLNLEDPRERARIRAKVLGSTVDEVVYTLYRLHLYGWLGDGNLVPFITMSNLNATHWKPQPDGTFSGTVYECGVYTKFDTDELIDVWENPVTGEKREVWTFFGGPFDTQLGPDGAKTGADATVKPVSMKMEVIGDVLFVPSGSAFSFPHPMNPQVWKKEVSGPTYYWDSHFVHAARVADVLDPSKNRAGAFSQFQNMVSWHPWFGMGNRPGRTYGKAYGSKLSGIDQLPKAVRANLEKKAPEIFDLPKWTKPRLDFLEYQRDRKPT